jgi:hypothetical protein
MWQIRARQWLIKVVTESFIILEYYLRERDTIMASILGDAVTPESRIYRSVGVVEGKILFSTPQFPFRGTGTGNQASIPITHARL